MGKQAIKLKPEIYTKYFSKWRGQWIDMGRPLTKGEVSKFKEYNYKLK